MGYSGGVKAGGGSIDWAVSSTFDRLEAALRDDPERLSQMRSARNAVSKVFEQHRVAPQDAHAMLSTYREYALKTRSAEALAKRWPAEWETIRLAAGSTEAAEKVLADANALYAALKTADPAFAQSVGISGAAQDARVIQAAAKYPRTTVSQTQEK
jgi:hypothetical protein